MSTIAVYSGVAGRTDPGTVILIVCLFYQPLSTSVAAVCIRSSAVLMAVYKHPATSLSSIPKNWIRSVLCTDVHCLPEIIPKYNLQGSDSLCRIPILGAAMWESLRHGPRGIMFFVNAMLYFITIIVASFLYRWTMKSTAIVYTPLLWLVWSTFRKMPDIAAGLRRLRGGDLTKVVVFYSFIVIGGFVVKFILMVKWDNFAAWWNSTPLTDFLSIYVAPAEIPLWQLAAFINAFWAIGIFIFAGEALWGMDSGTPWSPKRVEFVLRVSSFGRCVLTLYTITCTVYLTVQEASSWNFPTLGTKLFPWW